MHTPSQQGPEFIRRCEQIVRMVIFSVLLLFMSVVFIFFQNFKPHGNKRRPALRAAEGKKDGDVWVAPDSTRIPLTPEGDLIRYGRDLIAHTAKYLGPNGKVKRISNGMNCQNCHLRAGTKPFGNNYAAVAATYPKFRTRSGSVESMEKRINDCIERSLNGKKLDEGSREMRAIMAYFKWLGKDVEKGVVPIGTGITPLPFMERAADPARGKSVYEKHCRKCHGPEGVGFKPADSIEWTYPPLAGMQSYGTAAGLHRLSRLAGYVKSNMPNGVSYENPLLSDEEAWDVAAYINSLPRPEKHFPGDWPDVTTKPFDHPFGPYADTFSEAHHKYGPFAPIRAARVKKKSR